MDWRGVTGVPPRAYVCGHCGSRVGSDKGWFTNSFTPAHCSIHLCPNCIKPSIFFDGKQYPGVLPGNPVDHLPPEIGSLYAEARSAIAAGAYTASVLASRKLLMNIAVDQGAAAGQSFMAYVEFLSTSGYIPPNGRLWVDHIRKKGNEATHEIQVMSQAEANELVSFSEMLLKFVFEFPAKVPPP